MKAQDQIIIDNEPNFQQGQTILKQKQIAKDIISNIQQNQKPNNSNDVNKLSKQNDLGHDCNGCSHMHDHEQAEYQQKRHQNQVKTAFVNYCKDMKLSYPNLFPEQGSSINKKKPIPKILEKYQDQVSKQMAECLQTNQSFLDLIIQYNNSCQQISCQQFQADSETMCHNISKIRTTVKQFFRQWCSESPELKDIFRIRNVVEKWVGTGKEKGQKGKVLVPGCGLGRLCVELVQAGYQVEGNQVTYFMLYGSNFILNYSQQVQQFTIHPFIHTTNNHESLSSMMRAARVPDKCPRDAIPENANFSMSAGQFTQIYGSSNNSCTFSSVVCCFFIDTANNVFKYIDTIWNVLEDGGVWVNYGPLLYHYKQMLNQVSIQVSWEMIREYAKLKGFVQIQQKQQDTLNKELQYVDMKKGIETTYCHDPKSSYQHIYTVSITLWRKVIVNQENKFF